VIDVVETAFLSLDGDRITEVHTVFDALTLAVQTGLIEAPASGRGGARATEESRRVQDDEPTRANI
jgi:hypothetical protein